MYVCKTVLTPKEGGKNTVYLKKNLLPWLFSNASTNKPQSNILEAYYITLLRPLNMVIYIFKLSIFLGDLTFMVAETLQKSKFLFYVLHLCYVFYYIFIIYFCLSCFYFSYIFLFSYYLVLNYYMISTRCSASKLSSSICM